MKNRTYYASKIQQVSPVELFFSVIFKKGWKEKEIKNYLSEKFNLSLRTSPVFSFTHTDYYEKEMGRNLKRFFLFAPCLYPFSLLTFIKHLTRRLEREVSKSGRRTLNIDPGFILLEKICLLTYKNYFHRFYLGEGVYGEVTLVYSKGKMEPMPWTYPDYSEKEVRELFKQERDKYKIMLRREGFF